MAGKAQGWEDSRGQDMQPARLIAAIAVIASCVSSDEHSIVFTDDGPLQPAGSPRVANSKGCAPGQIDIRIVNQVGTGTGCSPYPSPEGCCCGVGSTMGRPGSGVNGQARFASYPWQAAILTATNVFVGSGALVGRRHVVSVAHRLRWWDITDLKVRLGEWDTRDISEPLRHIDYTVVSVAIHPRFETRQLLNDVALLRLEADVEAGPHISPVCVPEVGATFVGQRCWVSGWGKDAFGPSGQYQAILREVDVPVLSLRDCERRLQGSRLGNGFLLDKNSFVCAGGEWGKDACTGDGGAPLVCEQAGTFYLVGLVAWGIGCAEPGLPGVYVNIPSYSSWLGRYLH